MKTITIITVTYNDLENLKKTVKSVQRQLINEVEYIIVDGKSNDGTGSYLSALKKDNIHWISEADTGIYDAMNKGIHLAKGEWIWFINAGDCLLDGALSLVINALPNVNDCLIAKVLETFEYKGYLWGKEIDTDRNLNNLKKGMIFSHQGLICRKSILEDVRMFDELFKIAADWDLIIRLYKKRIEFTFVDMCVCSYDKFGLSYRYSCIKERHEVRRKNQLYRAVDCWILADIISSIERKLINFLLGEKVRKIYIARKGFHRVFLE